jgi:hypothetical protein
MVTTARAMTTRRRVTVLSYTTAPLRTTTYIISSPVNDVRRIAVLLMLCFEKMAAE